MDTYIPEATEIDSASNPKNVMMDKKNQKTYLNELYNQDIAPEDSEKTLFYYLKTLVFSFLITGIRDDNRAVIVCGYIFFVCDVLRLHPWVFWHWGPRDHNPDNNHNNCHSIPLNSNPYKVAQVKEVEIELSHWLIHLSPNLSTLTNPLPQQLHHRLIHDQRLAWYGHLHQLRLTVHRLCLRSGDLRLQVHHPQLALLWLEAWSIVTLVYGQVWYFQLFQVLDQWETFVNSGVYVLA